VLDASDPYQAVADVVLPVPCLVVVDLNSEVESRVSHGLPAPRAFSFTKHDDDGLFAKPSIRGLLQFLCLCQFPQLTCFPFKVKQKSGMIPSVWKLGHWSLG